MAQGATLNVPAPGVLTNDTDADADPLTAVKTSNAANGVVTFNGDGSFSFTPDGAFAGVDSFNYYVTDGVAQSNPVTVSITVGAGAGPATPFAPSDDTYVRSNAATEVNRAATTLRSYKSGTTETRSYLKFTVSGMSSVTSAKLRLYVKDASPAGGAVPASHTA
jgi:hypothetical protein